MKKIIPAFLALVIAGIWIGMRKPEADNDRIIDTTNKRITAQIIGLKALLRANPIYNSDIVILADMKILSGKNRLFVYDLKKDMIIDRGLVAHGSGSETGVYGKLNFSNVPNSHCTSIGRYVIGKHYQGQFGKAYKLTGLDKTNSNAYARNIVLHSFETMPHLEQTAPICNSFGCPMVSVQFYERLQKYIDTSSKPVILDIYY